MDTTYPFLCTCMWPSIESVIWPIIMFLNDPDTEINTRTKTTPTVISEAVSIVLLLYLRRFLTAILKRLRIPGTLLKVLPLQLSILQSKQYLSLTHYLLVMGREQEGGTELVPHLFHKINHHIGCLMV